MSSWLAGISKNQSWGADKLEALTSGQEFLEGRRTVSWNPGSRRRPTK